MGLRIFYDQPFTGDASGVFFYNHRDSSPFLTISMAGYTLLSLLPRATGHCATQDEFYGMVRPPRLRGHSGSKRTAPSVRISLFYSTQVPHGLQQSMSSESRPRLSSAVPHFELFMTAWENKAQETPRLQPFIDVGLKWAKKYYKRMDNTRAYVVAMCKFTLVHSRVVID